jgi:hypothetical protein
MYDKIIDAIAEFIYGFVTTNIWTKIILLICNIPVFFLLGRLLFGNWKRFWHVLSVRHMWNLFAPFIILFRRDLLRKDSGLDLHRADFMLSMLHAWLFLLSYLFQYTMIKFLFLT